jgi:hypothetical protein
MPESDPLAFRIVALGTTLMRRCLDQGDAGDEQSAREICRQIAHMDDTHKILAVASGGVWAAYGPHGQVDADAWQDIIDITRIFLRADVYDGLITLASASMVLMVNSGISDRPADDLVLAAEEAWKVEHHELALTAARAALATSGSGTRNRIVALSLTARITNEADDIEAVQAEIARCAAENVDIGDVDTQVPGPAAANSGGYAAAIQALNAGDRASAAKHLADETHRLLELGRDPEAITGLERAFRAMSSADIDVPELRSGLIAVVRHLRTRQRFGSVPPAVRAALELVIFVLQADSDPAIASVTVELMEALADAGLSEVDLQGDREMPAIIEAQLADTARDFPLWPSLQDCVNGLGDAFALVLRNIGGGRSTRSRWLSAFIVPPSGVLTEARPITDTAAAVLETLGSNDPDEIARIDMTDLDETALQFFPHGAIDLLRQHPQKGLVIVPDGPLWNVPWQAAPSLRTTNLSLSPSLTVYHRLAPPPRRISHVVALIDDTVDDAHLVIDELLAARASSRLTVDFAPGSIGDECDLLIVLAHGAGSGLRFETALFAGSLNAYELAQQANCRTAIIAACWSAKSPPFALPLNLPTSLLLQGCTNCVGGLWPLPQRENRSLHRANRGLRRGGELSAARCLERTRTQIAEPGQLMGNDSDRAARRA